MRCLHPITRETSEIDSKGQNTLWRDFHVHGATAVPYWPILACGLRVQVTWANAEEFRRYSSFFRYELQNVWPSGE